MLTPGVKRSLLCGSTSVTPKGVSVTIGTTVQGTSRVRFLSGIYRSQGRRRVKGSPRRRTGERTPVVGAPGKNYGKEDSTQLGLNGDLA